MDSKVLQLMESADPQDRKKAIRMLAQIGGQESLRYLGQIYKRDEDPEVKNLAIQAGKLIKKQEAEETAAPSAPAPVAAKSAQRTPPVQVQQEEAVEEDEEPLEEFHPVNVSSSSEKQSKGLMERALDLSMHGEREKAIESIAKAFKINPNLRLDSYYMDLTMDVTGLPHDDAIRLVTADDKMRKAKNKEKSKNSGDVVNEEVSWETAILDLGLYYAVIAGIAIISMVLIIQAVTNGMASVPRTASSTSTIQTLQAFNNVGIVVSVLYGLVGAAFNVGFLVLFFGLMHMIATMMFGGEGTFRGLIHYGSLPLIVSNGVMGGIGLLTIYVSIRELFSPENINRAVPTISALDNPVFSILNLVSVIVSIGCMSWFVERIGKNYEFGWGRGCLTYIVSIIVICVGVCGCYFFVISSLLNSMRR